MLCDGTETQALLFNKSHCCVRPTLLSQSEIEALLLLVAHHSSAPLPCTQMGLMVKDLRHSIITCACFHILAYGTAEEIRIIGISLMRPDSSPYRSNGKAISSYVHLVNLNFMTNQMQTRCHLVGRGEGRVNPFPKQLIQL